MNEYLEHLGWLTINGGTVGGIAVGDILNPAVADFSASLLYGHAPLRVSFADRSSGSISSWSWAFGDGLGSSERNPVHTYTKPGVYTVSLTVTGPGGSDVETKNAYIEAIPRIPMPWLPLVLDD